MPFEGFFYEAQDSTSSGTGGKSEAEQREEALKAVMQSEWKLSEEDAAALARSQVNVEEAKKQGKDTSGVDVG